MEQGPGDDRPLDLRRAFVDAGGAHLAVEVLERVAGHEGPGTEDLDGGVDDELRRLRGVELGHGRQPGDVGRSAIVVGPGSVVDEEAGGLRPGGHVGQGVRHGLEVADGPAEGPPLAGVGTAWSSAAWAIPTANAPTLGRNRSSVRIATRNPALTSPSTSPGPTGTPSKTSRPMACGATMSIGSPDSPGRRRERRRRSRPGRRRRATCGRRPCRGRPRGRWRSRSSPRTGASRRRRVRRPAQGGGVRARSRLRQGEGRHGLAPGHGGHEAAGGLRRARLDHRVRTEALQRPAPSPPRCTPGPALPVGGTARWPTRRRRPSRRAASGTAGRAGPTRRAPGPAAG